jgi:Tol biopolymer transport system component
MTVLLPAITTVAILAASADAGSFSETTPALVVEQGSSLYAIAIDGSRRVRLAGVPGSEAAISRSGSTVAFARENGGISTMRLDGSHRRIVTRGPDHSPAWTADGKTLYFVRYNAGAVGDACGSIFTVTASGAGVRRVVDSSRTGHSYTNPAVSPDGRRIAFSDWDACSGGTSSPRLRVVDEYGHRTRDLALLRQNGYYPDPEHSSPAWSPDGTQIAFRRNSDLAVAHRDGSGERRLVSGGGYLIYEPPAWSPDGRWIAFAREAPSTVIVVEPDGSGLRRLVPLTTSYSLAGWLRSN